MPSVYQNKIDDLMRQWAIANPRPQYPVIAKGTPNRRELQEQAIRAWYASPEMTEYKAREDAARKAATEQAKRDRRGLMRKVREADPITRLTVLAQKHLCRMGFRRDHKSDSGSTYYSRGTIEVRVADHEVPETDSRRQAVLSGGFSWTGCGWQIIIGHNTSEIDVLRDLVHIRRKIKKTESQ